MESREASHWESQQNGAPAAPRPEVVQSASGNLRHRLREADLLRSRLASEARATVRPRPAGSEQRPRSKNTDGSKKTRMTHKKMRRHKKVTESLQWQFEDLKVTRSLDPCWLLLVAKITFPLLPSRSATPMKFLPPSFSLVFVVGRLRHPMIPPSGVHVLG